MEEVWKEGKRNEEMEMVNICNSGGLAHSRKEPRQQPKSKTLRNSQGLQEYDSLKRSYWQKNKKAAYLK